MRGLKTVNSYDSANTAVSTTVDEKALATAIATYEATLKDSAGNPRPFMTPGEICNVPAVAALVYGSGGRNDLVRQIVGNMTTRSNTFSVWAVGQAVQKVPGNVKYGLVETGDVVLSESRVHYLVERMIDPGKDGAIGNSSNSGADAVVSTPDDPGRRHLSSGDDLSAALQVPRRRRRGRLEIRPCESSCSSFCWPSRSGARTPRRRSVHVRDIAAATVLATERHDQGVQAFNVGSGTPRTVGDMAAALADALAGPAPVITGRFRLADVRHITADSSRLRERLGWQAEIQFEDGMRELAENHPT